MGQFVRATRVEVLIAGGILNYLMGRLDGLLKLLRLEAFTSSSQQDDPQLGFTLFESTHEIYHHLIKLRRMRLMWNMTGTERPACCPGHDIHHPWE